MFLLQANERGSDIRIDLDGKTDIKKGVTYSRFETVPDAPIASFETNLPEGPHSVLAANGNLCASKLAIPTALTGQNGAQVNQNTAVTVTGCPKTKVLTRAQKLALALKACHKKPKGTKRQACERHARKKYGPVKKKAKKAKRKWWREQGSSYVSAGELGRGSAPRPVSSGTAGVRGRRIVGSARRSARGCWRRLRRSWARSATAA